MNYIKKLGFNLLVLGCEIMAVLSVIAIFNHWWSPIVSVLSVVVWVAGTILLLNYGRGRIRGRPTLIATTVALVGIIILSAFAGVQPLASIKDNAINTIKEGVESTPIAPKPNPSLIGKWQEVKDNKVSILSPTIHFLNNGTVILDDGYTILTGSYKKLTDEYVRLNVETSFFGIPFESMDTIKYQIKNNRLIVRVGSGVKIYQRVEDW